MIFFFQIEDALSFFYFVFTNEKKKKKTVLTLAVQLTLNLLWDCSFLEEIMQLFWGTRLSPSQGEDAAPSRLYLQ